jgi:integrase
MPRYTKRDFQLGEWWLTQRKDSRAYYAVRFNRAKASNERRSLGTTELSVAQERLTELYLKTRKVHDEKPEEASLADVLRRYWENHASTTRSADSNRFCLDVWVEYWEDSPVSALKDITKQEAFHKALRNREFSPAGIMRVINIGKAALNRAYARGELAAVPRLLSVPIGRQKPMGRPIDLPDLQLIYANAAPHVQAFMLWALGTGARPEAIFQLHSRQIDFEHGLIDLNPPDREQVWKKYRPTVRLPDALWDRFEGYAVSYEGQPITTLTKSLARACKRAGVQPCSPYSFRHTAARWMRKSGVPPWEVAAQLGHSAGKEYAVTERYAFFSPDYLANAVKALDALVRAVFYGPVTGQSPNGGNAKSLTNMVPQEGIEPPTHALRICFRPFRLRSTAFNARQLQLR